LYPCKDSLFCRYNTIAIGKDNAGEFAHQPPSKRAKGTAKYRDENSTYRCQTNRSAKGTAESF